MNRIISILAFIFTILIGVIELTQSFQEEELTHYQKAIAAFIWAVILLIVTIKDENQ